MLNFETRAELLGNPFYLRFTSVIIVHIYKIYSSSAGLKKVKKYCLALLEFQTQSINVHFEVMYSRKFIYMLLIKKRFGLYPSM